MMAYRYAKMKNYLHGIAFKGRLAYAMWAWPVGALQGTGEFTEATQDQPAPTFSFPQMRRLYQNPQACRLDSCRWETRFERLVHMVFIADIGWDERQVVNGFSEFRGH